MKLRLAAELGTVVPLMVNYFFERPARMVNRRTSLREPYGQQMINLQRLRNTEEGLEHDAEIGRGYIADVHGTEPQHLGGQQHLQDAIRQAAVKVRTCPALCAWGRRRSCADRRARVIEPAHGGSPHRH